MPEFTGSLRLASDPATSVVADVVVDNDRLVLSAGSSQIGDWARREIDISVSSEGFRLRADGEDLILAITDPAGFAEAVGIEPFDPRRDGGTESGPQRARPAAGRRGGRVPFPTADSLSSRFTKLRQRSAVGYRDDTTLQQVFVWPLVGSAALLALGALLGWGPFHLIGDTSFPLARLLAAVAAVAAAVGVYLSFRSHMRPTGVPMIVASSSFSLLVIYAYANEAGLRIGFLLSFIGAIGLGALGGIAMTDWGATPRHPDDKKK